MMVMLNALYKKQNDLKQDIDSSKYRHSELAGEIIDYINSHITEKLQISTIAKQFFLSETYVCRVFKAETGTTINKYLTARRISIAKALLADGYSVAETCEKADLMIILILSKLLQRRSEFLPKNMENTVQIKVCLLLLQSKNLQLSRVRLALDEPRPRASRKPLLFCKAH